MCGDRTDNSRTVEFLHLSCLNLTLPLHPPTEVGMCQGVSAKAAEHRKHTGNDPKCAELGWQCIRLVVGNVVAWGPKAPRIFSQVASRSAIHDNLTSPR